MCIRLAIAKLKSGDLNKSISYAEKAKIWPRNLGVGKPYDVDERLENYLLALAHEKNGNREKANTYYQMVLNHRTPDDVNESTRLIFQLLVLISLQILHKGIFNLMDY